MAADSQLTFDEAMELSAKTQTGKVKYGKDPIMQHNLVITGRPDKTRHGITIRAMQPREREDNK